MSTAGAVLSISKQDVIWNEFRGYLLLHLARA